jgi:hypothetical protein
MEEPVDADAGAYSRVRAMRSISRVSSENFACEENFERKCEVRAPSHLDGLK